MGAGAEKLTGHIAIEASDGKAVTRKSPAFQPRIDERRPDHAPMRLAVIPYVVNGQKPWFGFPATTALPSIRTKDFKTQLPTSFPRIGSGGVDGAGFAPGRQPPFFGIKIRYGQNQAALRATPMRRRSKLQDLPTRPTDISPSPNSPLGRQARQAIPVLSSTTKFFWRFILSALPTPIKTLGNWNRHAV